MTTPTCFVHCSIVDDMGSPVDGATISAKLNTFEVYQGHIVPREVDATTGVDGLATLVLWPNQLGSVSSYYNITITTPDGNVLRTTATVPNAATANLHEISALPPYPGKSDGQLALDAAVAAGVLATAKAGEAAASAAAAAQSQTFVTTKANEVSASAANALAIYGSVSSVQSAVNMATIKAGEASASAAAAAASAFALATVSSFIPGQIVTLATPITTDGSIVKTISDGATTVANLYHLTTGPSPSVRISCMTSGYSFNITDGRAVASGSSGVDTFYVGKTAYVDASITGAGIDVIYLPFSSHQYTMTVVSTNVLLRGPSASDGRMHGVLVASGTILVHDKVVFADGWAYSNDIKTAITNGVAVTLSTDLTTPATPPASAYLVVGPTANNMLFVDNRAVSRTDWPGTFALFGTKYGPGDGINTFNLPAVDPSDKTLLPRSGVAGLYAYVQGF